MCNQIKQIKKHVTNFGAMLTELSSGQTCKYIIRGANKMEVRERVRECCVCVCVCVRERERVHSRIDGYT